MGLSSIVDLPPLENGGRNARRGFAFQDHAAARLCLDAVANGAPDEIRLEQYDDVTLLWRSDEGDIAEFVQIKAHNRPARWSAAALTAGDGTGASLLEKSLRQARGRELSRFRIITTTDTDDRLSLLKLPLHHPERSSLAFAELAEDLSRRLPGLTSENGMTVGDWARACVWEKPADTIDALQALNIRLLEQALSARGVNVPYAKRDDIYESLLRKIATASTADDSEASRLTTATLREWLEHELSEITTVLWTEVDIDATIARCRATTKVEIETRVGRKYIPELYVAREIDHACTAFVTGEDQAFLLVEKAGSGKTNLLCNLSLRLATEYPVLFLSGRLALSTGGLVAEVLERFGLHHDDAFRELEATSKSLLVVIDGINENNDPHGMRDALIRLIQFAAGKPMKLIVSCRDLFWPAFDGEHWGNRSVRAKARSHALHDFTAGEFEKARKRYFDYFKVTADLRGEARLKCRHPLLLRFFCEAYGSTESDHAVIASAFDDIRLKTLFDVYWSRKLERIREFSDNPMVKGAIIDVLFAMAGFLLRNHRKDIARSELHTIGAPIGSALAGVLSRICDEDIIVAQDGDLGVTAFVYDEFMEYTMARMLFVVHRYQEATGSEVTRNIIDLLEAKREYSHVQNVAQYLLLWVEDDHPDIHDQVVLALVRSGRAICRRVVASAAPKFRRVSPQNLRALEIAAADGDDTERGEIAFAVARLHRHGVDSEPLTKIFRSLAKRASTFVAVSLLGGLETATALSRETVGFVVQWSSHREARVRMAVANFIAADAARAEPELRSVLRTLAMDIDHSVQDAALLSARVVLVSAPDQYLELLLDASSYGGVAAGVSWLIDESTMVAHLDREALARELVSRRDSTLDKAALKLARTLEDPLAGTAIGEAVCQHMDYRSFHEGAKLALAYGNRESYVEKYVSLARELSSARVFNRGALRKTQSSLRRRRTLIERIFETVDWLFLADIDSEATLAICRELFGTRGISDQRLGTFLTNLQPLMAKTGPTDARATSLVIEAVRQGIARHADELVTWAERHVQVAESWSVEQLVELLDVLTGFDSRVVGYAGFLRYLQGVRSEKVLVEISRRLVRTGLSGVCAAVMRLVTSEPRSEAAIEAILAEADQWPLPACKAVALAVHVTDDSSAVLAGLGHLWLREHLFEPLLDLTARIEQEHPVSMPEWCRVLRDAGLYDYVLNAESYIRAYGQDFSSVDVKNAALHVLHAQWVMLCNRASVGQRARGYADISDLAGWETEVFSWC